MLYKRVHRCGLTVCHNHQCQMWHNTLCRMWHKHVLYKGWHGVLQDYITPKKHWPWWKSPTSGNWKWLSSGTKLKLPQYTNTHTHTHEYNEPYRVVLGQVRSLTNSPIVTGCYQALQVGLCLLQIILALTHTNTSFAGPSTHLNPQ
jgi:hypothetical protein